MFESANHMTMYNPEFVRRVHKDRRDEMRRREEKKRQERIEARRLMEEERRRIEAAIRAERLLDFDAHVTDYFQHRLNVRKEKIAQSRFEKYHAILLEVADNHSVSVNEMLSHKKPTKLVEARNEAYYRLRNELEMSLPLIGRKMGGRDHTTVLHGIRRHEERIGVKPA